MKEKLLLTIFLGSAMVMAVFALMLICPGCSINNNELFHSGGRSESGAIFLAIIIFWPLPMIFLICGIALAAVSQSKMIKLFSIALLILAVAIFSAVLRF